MVEEYSPPENIVTLTDSAIEHFRNFLEDCNGIGISISLIKKGCSGFSYSVKTEESIPKDHQSFVQDKINFYVDNHALEYLRGLEISYVKGTLGTHSLVYKNPNEYARCGCGESFTISIKV